MGIEIYDSKGELLDANEACLNIFGIVNADEIKQFKLFEDPNLTDDIKERLLNGEDIRYEFPFDFEIVKKHQLYQTTKSGIYHLEITITQLGGIESPKGYLAQIQDITDKKIAENALIESQRLSAIGEMASAIAHDFNNSLQSIFGNLELVLLEDDLSESVRQYLETTKMAASDAAKRVKVLQRFGGKKQENGEYVSVSINKLIDDVILQTRPLWKDQMEKLGASISINQNYGEVPNILGNSGELRMVFYNVIKNGVEAMPEGGELTFETGKNIQGVYATITDTGIGMDEKTKTRIFQPFSSTKGFELGRGLGMTGVWTVIKEHNGSIEVISAPRKGTSIIITLPHLEEEVKSIENGVTEYIGSARILWVDDEEIIRKLGKKQIAIINEKWTADFASNGHEALDYLAKYEYDLIITDIGMPGMSGLQLAGQIKEKYEGKMKVALATGWGAQISDEDKEKYGIGYILEKPFKLEQLKNLIGEAMQMTRK